MNPPILYCYSKTARTNLFLGYFAHIVRRERDGLISKNLRYCKVIILGDVVVDLAVVNLKVRLIVTLALRVCSIL